MFDPYPFQVQGIDDLRRSIKSGHRAPLFVAPTGSGKTIVAASVIKTAAGKSRRVLFLAPRRELIYQTSAKLKALEVEHGILMSGENPSLMPAVQIGCIPTMYKRCFEDGEPVKASLFTKKVELPPADLVIVDEAHASFSTMTRKILAAYPNAIKIGMTATPARSDGRGLGEIYDDLVMGPTIGWLTDQGYLVPVRYFGCGEHADLSHVSSQHGDYVVSQLGDVMNQPKLIGDVYENWSRIASDRQTVIFAVNRAHARSLQDEFRRHQVATEYLDGETPNDERADILRRFEACEFRVLSSVDVLSYGWDSPAASCAVFARPTKSIARYLQMAGRVLRTHPGKKDCYLIDHGEAVKDLGYVDDDHPWSLDGGSKIQDRMELLKKEPKLMTCPECKEMVKAAPVCPSCGHDMHREHRKAIEAWQADLVELTRKAKKQEDMPKDERGRFYAELKWIGDRRGYKPGWSAMKYRDRFGSWPDEHRGLKAIRPSAKTESWVRSQMIRYAKGVARGKRDQRAG